MAFWKESMINRLSNLINRNRSAAKISQVLCSNLYPIQNRANDTLSKDKCAKPTLVFLAAFPNRHGTSERG